MRACLGVEFGGLESAVGALKGVRDTVSAFRPTLEREVTVSFVKWEGKATVE